LTRGDRSVFGARFDFQKGLEFSDRRRVRWRTFEHYFDCSHGTMFVVTDLGGRCGWEQKAKGKSQKAENQHLLSAFCLLLFAFCLLSFQNLFLNLISKL
jgi:hypothetical protein